VPSATLDAMLPTLLRKLDNADTVVFHCALSQQRGPSAALKYLRAREARDKDKVDAKGQKVYILDRGFVGWQETYGEDERLTEAYVKDLWKDGY
jgi:rhodanese-related sulfurtransferase